MTAQLRVQAPAKINLCLEVLRQRPDGYHEIRTIMQAVSLFDELSFSVRADDQIVLRASDEHLPPACDNLVVRAARLLQQRGACRPGADVELVKKIPVGRGLGGGSSDCAATLCALNRLWGLGLSLDALAGLAPELGSDVAFFIRGGTALCEGRGERITMLPVRSALHYVLVLPHESIFTSRAYGAFDGVLTKRKQPGSIGAVQAALATGDAKRLGSALYNDLEVPAFRLNPHVQRIRQMFQLACARLGCLGLSLSGSGSGLFGVFETRRRARRAALQLGEQLEVPCLAVHSLPAARDGSGGSAQSEGLRP